MASDRFEFRAHPNGTHRFGKFDVVLENTAHRRGTKIEQRMKVGYRTGLDEMELLTAVTDKYVKSCWEERLDRPERLRKVRSQSMRHESQS